jgi:AraC-like DNA-binding protein
MKMNPSSLVTHFSTDALPERDRTAIWREAFGRQIVKAEFDPNPDGRYCYAATFYSLPGLSLATSICEGFRAVRTPRLVAEGNEDVILTVNTLGVAEASQLRRETQIGLYEGVLLSAAEVGAIQYADRARSIVLRLPRQILASVKDLEAAFARRLPQTKGFRLLTSYATALDGQSLTSPTLQQAVAAHLADLVLLAVDDRCEAAELARGRGLAAARLHVIKSDIIARLSDERLSVAHIARTHRTTPRYIQMLFEAAGTTFSEYLIEQRLARAYHMLVDARFRERTVSAIAFDVGFANLSYFNRRFRRRYGATPSEVREAAFAG